MFVKCENIIGYMNELAPECLAEAWDNVGLLVGNKNNIVKKVLIALDATNPVIDEAIEMSIDLIITHHPLSLQSVNKITYDTFDGKVYKLIQNNIGVYSAHTNFDAIFGGTNDILAKKLEVKNIEVLENTYIMNSNSKDKNCGIGRIGTLEKEMSLSDYAKLVKEKLGLSHINVVGDINKKINKVALCSGNGSAYFETAIQQEADVYISGDLRYHDALKALDFGICWIDATHYASENIAMPVLKQYLEDKSKKENWEVEFFNSKINGQPFINI